MLLPTSAPPPVPGARASVERYSCPIHTAVLFSVPTGKPLEPARCRAKFSAPTPASEEPCPSALSGRDQRSRGGRRRSRPASGGLTRARRPLPMSQRGGGGRGGASGAICGMNGQTLLVFGNFKVTNFPRDRTLFVEGCRAYICLDCSVFVVVIIFCMN